MPGIPTRMALLDLVRDRLLASGDPEAQSMGTILKDHPAYANLGAVGQSLGDFLPGDVAPLDPGFPYPTPLSPYLQVWQQVFSVLGGDPSTSTPGLMDVLIKLTDFLDRLTTIANAEDEAALLAMQDELGTVQDTAASLNTIVLGMQDVAINVASIIGGARPSITPPAVGGPVPPPQAWHARDLLHWRRTGAFAEALVKRARESGDERFRAYAYGYVIAFSAQAAGNPFVNSVVGGPFRLHWWRHRWVSNHVDAWVWGQVHTGAAMSGDTPLPAYSTWPPLCSANLHERIQVTPLDATDMLRRVVEKKPYDLGLLGDDFVAYWYGAYADAFGADFAAESRIKPETLNGAYAMLWLVLWLQTSGNPLVCNPTPPAAPPDGCGGDPPDWVDPTVPTPDGTPSLPPSPSVENDPDVGKIISGIILALLGGAAFFFGGAAAGAAGIAAGIGLVVDGVIEPDFEKLRCELHWYRLYMYHARQALLEILTLGAMTFPAPEALDDDETVLNLLGVDFRFDSGKRVVKSRPRRDEYPAAMWSGFPALWTTEPPGIEPPTAIGYLHAKYPTWFTHDPANPLSNGDVKTPGDWPVRMGTDGKGLPDFGNVVECALDLLVNLGHQIPPWNLDADRGVASHTWQFATDTYEVPVAIDPEA